MYLIVFDCDGTLVDGQHSVLQGFEASFKQVGLPLPSHNDILSTIGLSLEQALLHIVGDPNREIIPQLIEAFHKEKIHRRSQGLDHDPLYPGVKQTLEELAAMDNVLLGIATGKHSRGVDHMLDVHQLHGKFVTIQTADKAPSKPNPTMLYQAMSEAGTSPQNTIMIGDTTFDTMMAQNAGVRSIGVNWGYHKRKELLRTGACQVIDRFEALIPSLAHQLEWTEDVC
ncbi:HAD-IA family hydrolase [Flexibacterium corallicola]|uniref:HAD-IA family hydrolase n=1 Tax=Flexibacterium corallicola TaxID=3037259 RepID=UPI00286F1EFD|nr:HAD-IA family hydrolase [Pseudovibrio sp. M1P-2-3]